MAAVAVALVLLAGVCYLVAKEKAGKPLFTNLDALRPRTRKRGDASMPGRGSALSRSVENVRLR